MRRQGDLRCGKTERQGLAAKDLERPLQLEIPVHFPQLVGITRHRPEPAVGAVLQLNALLGALRPKAQDAQGPHPLRVHLQSLGFPAPTLLYQSAPANPGTEHLESTQPRASGPRVPPVCPSADPSMPRWPWRAAASSPGSAGFSSSERGRAIPGFRADCRRSCPEW
jgi:hypothetical protein